MKAFLAKVMRGERLSEEEASAAMNVIMDGEATAAQIGALLAALSVRGESEDEVVGFALWYRTFSTWQGKPGIWLEDLFVRPDHRGSGLGKALLVSLAQIAVRRGWGRFEWWVLDWNEPAHGFYRSLGARPEDEWTVWRVDGEALRELGS